MLRTGQKIKNGECPTLAFLGDSVTQGCFEFQNGFKDTATRPEQAFPSLLKERISGELNRDINVINAGVAGEFAHQGLERLQSDVLAKKPDFCCVMFGTNDVTNSRNGAEGLKQYEDSMSEILTRLQSSGIEVVLMTPAMLCSRGVKGFRGFWWFVHKYFESLQKKGHMDQYVESTRKVAANMDVPVADVYAEWQKMANAGVDTTALLINGMNHPAPEQHRLFSDALFNLLFSD